MFGIFGYNYLITSIKTGIDDSDDENEEESSNKIIKVAVKLKDFISTGEIDERNMIILKEFNEEDINLTKRC